MRPERCAHQFYVHLLLNADVVQWELGLGVSGQADLYIDGKKLIDNSTDQQLSVLFVCISSLSMRLTTR
jgi:hypothetical protein